MASMAQAARHLTVGSPHDVFKQLVLQRTLLRMGLPSGQSAPFTFFSPFADGRQFALKHQIEAHGDAYNEGFGKLKDNMEDITHYLPLTHTRRHFDAYIQMVRRLNRRWVRQSGVPRATENHGPAFLAGDFAHEEARIEALTEPYFPSASDIAEVFMGPQDHMVLGSGRYPGATEAYKKYFYPDGKTYHSQLMDKERRKPLLHLQDFIRESDLGTLMPKSLDGLAWFDLGEHYNAHNFNLQGDMLKATYKLWPTATYVMCYPILGQRPAQVFRKVKATGSTQVLNAEFYTQPYNLSETYEDPEWVVHDDPQQPGLAPIKLFYQGSGVLVINPPIDLDFDLKGIIDVMEDMWTPPAPTFHHIDRPTHLPRERVTFWPDTAYKIVGRHHDRPSWGKFSHRGMEWTEKTASRFARADLDHFIKEHNIHRLPEIDPHRIPASVFDPAHNKMAAQNPNKSPRQIAELMDEIILEQAVFKSQDEYLKPHFRHANLSR